MPKGQRFDPYRVLGVAAGASRDEIARAYRALAKQLHPDLHEADRDGADRARQMQDLNRAFRILSDPSRRRAWDAQAAARAAPEPHWRGVARHDGPDDQAHAGPQRWATWETAGSRSSVDATVRVRAAWPRPAAPPPATRGLRDSIWPALGVSLVLVLAIITLGWIASTGPTARSPQQAFGFLGISPAASVALDPGYQLAVFERRQGGLGLVVAEREGEAWEARIIAETASQRPYSVLLVPDGAERQEPWVAVAYGRAQPDVDEVRLVGIEGRGGEVTGGAWAIAVAEPLTASGLAWEFVAPDGSVLLEGRGELGG